MTLGLVPLKEPVPFSSLRVLQKRVSTNLLPMTKDEYNEARRLVLALTTVALNSQGQLVRMGIPVREAHDTIKKVLEEVVREWERYP